MFLDCGEITKDQVDQIGELLGQIKKGKATITYFSYRQVLPSENICNDIHCSHVLTFLWEIIREEEMNLPSSWKTEVNIACMEVIGKKAVGFADISKDGVILYY